MQTTEIFKHHFVSDATTDVCLFWNPVQRIQKYSKYQEYGVQQARALYLPPILGKEKRFYKCEFSSGHYTMKWQFKIAPYTSSSLMCLEVLAAKEFNKIFSGREQSQGVNFSTISGTDMTLPDRVSPWNIGEIHTWARLSAREDCIDFIFCVPHKRNYFHSRNVTIFL